MKIEIIDKIFNLRKFEEKHSLEKIEKGFKLININPRDLKCVHVTGTNGKGSVCWKVFKSLEYSGIRTGIFTSPHINSFRERIRINDEYIDVESVESGVEEILEKTKGLNLCFFEIITLLAIKYFVEKRVEIAVIEVGIGGRLDETNVVVPLVSVITSIGLDHCEILGGTIEEIGKEKGGIIKENVPVVLGPTANIDIIRKIGLEKRSEIRLAKIGENSKYDEINSEISREVLKCLQSSNEKLSDRSIEEGVKERPMCRMESVNYKNQNYILDSAHNPAAFENLFNSINKINEMHICVSFSGDKDIDSCIDIILKNIKMENIHILKSVNKRGISGESLVKKFQEKNELFMNTDCYEIKEMVEYLSKNLKSESTILICGTMYILGGFRESLNLDIVYP